MTNVQTRHHSVCDLQCSCRGQAPLFQNPPVIQRSKISTKKVKPNQFDSGEILRGILMPWGFLGKTVNHRLDFSLFPFGLTVY